MTNPKEIDVYTLSALASTWPGGASVIASRKGELENVLRNGGYFKIAEDGTVTAMMHDGISAVPTTGDIGKLNAQELGEAGKHRDTPIADKDERTATINGMLRRAGAAVPTEPEKIKAMLGHFQEAAHIKQTGEPDDDTLKAAKLYLENYEAKIRELYKQHMGAMLEKEPTYEQAAAYYKQYPNANVTKEARKYAIDEVKKQHTPPAPPALGVPAPDEAAIEAAKRNYRPQYNRNGSLVAPGQKPDTSPADPRVDRHAHPEVRPDPTAQLDQIIQRMGAGKDRVELKPEEKRIVSELMSSNQFFQGSPMDTMTLGDANTASAKALADLQASVRARIEEKTKNENPSLSLYPNEQPNVGDSQYGKPSKLTLIALKEVIARGGMQEGKYPEGALDAAADAVIKTMREENLTNGNNKDGTNKPGLHMVPGMKPKTAYHQVPEEHQLDLQEIRRRLAAYSDQQIAQQQTGDAFRDSHVDIAHLGGLVATFSGGAANRQPPAPPEPPVPAGDGGGITRRLT